MRSGSSPRERQHALKGKHMKKTKKRTPKPFHEYDFRTGARGKYAKRYARGTNLIVLEPSLAKAFPDSKSVNDALRSIVESHRHRKSA